MAIKQFTKICPTCGIEFTRSHDRSIRCSYKCSASFRFQKTAERFWKLVDKADCCWKWKSSLNNKGYGQFGCVYRGKWRTVLAHRYSWELNRGPISKGGLILHRCDNPSCVNPAHLFIGTQAENLADMVQKGRAYKGGATRGEQNGNHKIRACDAIQIRDAPGTLHEVALQFGISPSQILRIRQLKSWAHV